MKAKSIAILIFGLMATAIVGCSADGIHGGTVNHESQTSSHGSSEETHGNESSAGTHDSEESTHAEVSQSTATGQGQFPTIGLEERVEATIPFSIMEVCPLFEPAGRFLMYDWWNPTILQEAQGETLEGLIMSDHGFGLDTLLKVTKHSPDEGSIQYIVLWGDFELQRIDITCVEGDTADSTKVVWNEQNTGMYENGASVVTTYVTGGHLRNNVENYTQNATKYLQEQ